MEEALISTNNGYILFDKSRIPAPSSSLFDQSHQLKNATTNTLGRGSAVIFDLQGTDVVLKHYQRGGLFGKIVKNMYRFTTIDDTRMFKEFRLLGKMHALGLPVPAPVAANVVKNWGTYSGDLITVKIDEALTLAEKLFESPLTEDVWCRVGETIRKFHNHDIYHADLNANNIMINNLDQVFLIDFDKSDFRRDNTTSWKQKNLERLLRSLKKINTNEPQFKFDELFWGNLLKGYQQLSIPAGA